ncbi:MAG: hypothetical protein HQM06_11820 [Magnetococcales bacterium]|nr:hypothetical protein [Magnetococcales bacterium]
MNNAAPTSADLQQMIALVHNLTHALHEERQERLRERRRQRWTGRVFALALLAGGWILGSQGTQQALANTDLRPVQEMDEVGKLLQAVNLMASKIMPQLNEKSPHSEKQSTLEQFVADSVQLVHNLRGMTDLFGMALVNPVDQHNVQQMIRDLPVLSMRIKQDSDVLRTFILEQQQRREPQTPLPNPYANFNPDGKHYTPEQLNSLRASATMLLPSMQEAMRGELNYLNRSIAQMGWNMGVMAGSMGSTMGRIGSWMP